MSYFNHAFNKVFLGTGTTRVGSISPTDPATTDGFITDSGTPSMALAAIGPGYFGFYDKDNYLSVAAADLTSRGCCPLVLASASLKANDKQGPHHGGYKESNKSKYINPKLISKWYRVDQCVPQQNIIHIGNTNFTGAATGAVNELNQSTIDPATGGYTDPGATNVATTTDGAGTGCTVNYVTDGAGDIIGVSINHDGSGYAIGDTLFIVGGTASDAEILISHVVESQAANANCNIPFYCDETYYLRIDVKGSPALRFANHNLYRTLQADGGCCSGPVPTEIDSTLIMIQWAQHIVEDPYFTNFIQPLVFDESGTPWFQTAAQAVTAGWTTAQLWSLYVSPGHTVGQSAGLRLLGAYVDTTFTNCSFAITDHYEKEPIRILASLVDYQGDPCVFEGLCVIEECPALQGMGFGEQVVRDLIQSEAYLQNFFATDKRIQEITQGDQILGAVTRNALYTRYYIQHTVPRFNNPSSVFDNDQYLLEIITSQKNTDLEKFMETWLDGCSDCYELQEFTCNHCDVTPVPVAPGVL